MYIVKTSLIGRELPDCDLFPVNSYEVHVFTGSLWGSGTDANVYINLYGEIGDTGERQLRHSNKMNKFERGQVSVVVIRSFITL